MPPSIELQEHMRQTAIERQERYEVKLVDAWPTITDIDTQVFLGSFSWTLPAIKQRWLYSPTAITIGNGPQSPTEITRDYLDWKYPKPLRCCTGQYQEIMRHRSFPCYSQRGKHGECVYVDLKSAYWSIMLVLGWDVDYWPGKWLAKKSDVTDFPLQDHKAARSSLVSMGLSSQIRLWTGRTLKWKKGRNAHLNYGLWAVTQDVLHGVASEMLSLGAVYVHTDGYIVPLAMADTAIQIANDWGFRASIKAAGDTEVFGVGVYRVGEKQTKRFRAIPGDDHININPNLVPWLKSHFSVWANRVYRKL